MVLFLTTTICIKRNGDLRSGENPFSLLLESDIIKPFKSIPCLIRFQMCVLLLFLFTQLSPFNSQTLKNLANLHKGIFPVWMWRTSAEEAILKG